MCYFYDVVFCDTYGNKYHVKFHLGNKFSKAYLCFFLKQFFLYRLSNNRIVYSSLHFKVFKVDY